MPHRPVGDTVQLTVWHFSGAGVLTARLDELQAALSYEPAHRAPLAEQRIAAALVDQQVNGSDPGPAISVALRSWRLFELGQPGAPDRRQHHPARLLRARLRRMARLARLPAGVPEHDRSGRRELLRHRDGARSQRRHRVGGGRRPAPTRPLPRPRPPPSASTRRARVASAVNLADLPIETAEAPARPSRSRRAATFRPPASTSSCWAWGAPARWPGTATTASPRARTSSSGAFPEHLDPAALPARRRHECPGAGGERAATSGTFSTTVRPGAHGVRTLELAVGLGDDTVLRTFFDQVDSTVRCRSGRAPGPAPGRFRLHDTSPPSGPAARCSWRSLAGHDVGSIPVALTHDGSGLLPPSTTTDRTARRPRLPAPAADGGELHRHDHR